MTNEMLTLFKFGLLALLYLFFVRTLWAVWTEVRTSRVGVPLNPQRNPPKPSRAQSKAAQSKAARSKRAPSRPVKAAKVRTGGTGAAGRGHGPTRAAVPNAGAAMTELPRGVLVVVEPASLAGQTYDLGQELTVGRAPGCGVSIDDTFVSTLHARVYAANGTWIVEDLGSTNGTLFNGEQLTEPRVMNLSDRIRLGSTVLELK